MYHTPLNNTRFSIDACNVLIASIYLHQCFYILKILAHSVDFNELYCNITIHCPSFKFSEIDLSQLLYSFWRVGIIRSKLKNKLRIMHNSRNTRRSGERRTPNVYLLMCSVILGNILR